MIENYELIKAWVELRAPDETIKQLLLRGLNMVNFEETARDVRAKKFPNEGNQYTPEECAEILKIRKDLEFSYAADYTDYAAIFKREKEIESLFGRPIKSIKNKLRYMLKVGVK